MLRIGAWCDSHIITCFSYLAWKCSNISIWKNEITTVITLHGDLIFQNEVELATKEGLFLLVLKHPIEQIISSNTYYEGLLKGKCGSISKNQ